jgi:hypothetical protein
MWFEPMSGELFTELRANLSRQEARELLAALQEWSRGDRKREWHTRVGDEGAQLTIVVNDPAAGTAPDGDDRVADEDLQEAVRLDWWQAYGETELRHLMLLWWDPVGVYGDPSGVSEYETELRALGELVRSGAGADEILAFLRATGLPQNDARDERAARLIAEWYQRAMRRLFDA